MEKSSGTESWKLSTWKLENPTSNAIYGHTDKERIAAVQVEMHTCKN